MSIVCHHVYTFTHIQDAKEIHKDTGGMLTPAQTIIHAQEESMTMKL